MHTNYELPDMMDKRVLYSIQQRNTKQLQTLLTRTNINVVDEYGYTALHYAARYEHVEGVSLCIALGADISMKTDAGLTPLFVASFRGNYKTCRALLDAGANADDVYESANGKAPKLSIEVTGGTCSPLCEAIQAENRKIAKLLIDRGASMKLVKEIKIPEWIDTFLASRSNCRNAVVVVMGIHKYHRSRIIVPHIDVHVCKMLVKLIWASRMDEELWNLNLDDKLFI
jgi:ankyrin repeat protein